ncbi:MAG: hypothetical protein D3924_06965 [Candidatus Electrothrix sp. AR4]|nr:hypothetical protein [Candidatus Electrothrix sp. AR4]
MWCVLSGAAFLGQFSHNAGAGAWVTGVTSTGCFVIFLLALKQGDRNFTSSDAFSLLFAVFIFSLWALTETPLYSIILIAIVDSVGFYPTYRKSVNKPNEEAVTTYFLCGLKFFIALAALKNYTVITVLYPFCLVITNWMLVTLLIIRRKKRTVYGFI